MSEYKIIRVKSMDYDNYLNYLRENQCINCFNYHGEIMIISIKVVKDV